MLQKIDDFALVSEFENLETMQRYQVHPAHQKVVAKIKEVCDSILVAGVARLTT